MEFNPNLILILILLTMTPYLLHTHATTEYLKS
jgi:hypothetical protein